MCQFKLNDTMMVPWRGLGQGVGNLAVKVEGQAEPAEPGVGFNPSTVQATQPELVSQQRAVEDTPSELRRGIKSELLFPFKIQSFEIYHFIASSQEPAVESFGSVTSQHHSSATPLPCQDNSA